MDRLAEESIEYRDLKPGNILVAEHGCPHIADFGLAVSEDTQRLQAGQDIAVVAYGSMDAKVAAGRDVGYVWVRGNLTGVISAGRNIGRFEDNYYYDPYDYDVFSYGSIDAAIVAPNTTGGKIGSVGAWYTIAGCIRAATSIGTVHAGGAITATIIAPQIGSVIQNDASLRTSHPYPSTPDSIKDEVLAEGAAVYAEVLADRALVGAEIEAALAEIAAERVRAFGKLAETRAEVDAGIKAAKVRSQQRLNAARAAAIQDFQDAADAAHGEMDLLEGLTKQDREELEAIVRKVRAEDDEAYKKAVAERDALPPKLADLDRQMADLKQKDAADAAAEKVARDQQWEAHARELLRVLQPSARGGYSGDPLDQLDRLGAGIADMVTFGWTTKFRENVYGEIATRNHQGFCYRLGQVVGFGTSLGLGYLGAGRGAGWAWQAARYYTSAATIYGFGESTYHLLAGDFRWYHTFGFVPLAGFMLNRAKPFMYQMYGLGPRSCGMRLHVAYGAERVWVHATHGLLGGPCRMTVETVTARWIGKFYDRRYFWLRLPVLFPERVVRPNTSAWYCLTSAWHGFFRGWIPFLP